MGREEAKLNAGEDGIRTALPRRFAGMLLLPRRVGPRQLQNPARQGAAGVARLRSAGCFGGRVLYGLVVLALQINSEPWQRLTSQQAQTPHEAAKSVNCAIKDAVRPRSRCQARGQQSLRGHLDTRMCAP